MINVLPKSVQMDDPAASLSVLFPRHEAYLLEAQRMQKKYADKIHILIGFEGEWIRPDYGPLIKQLADEPAVDYFIGSLHHTCGIPIDYDRQTYDRAIAAVFKNRGVDDIEDIGYDDREKALYETYYDEQYELLTALKPRVIGHFDLVCLLSIKPSRDIKALWPDVWDKVVRNLKAVVEYGGWLECNTSGLRKGLDTPYPSRNIAEVRIPDYAFFRIVGADSYTTGVFRAWWQIHIFRRQSWYCANWHQL